MNYTLELELDSGDQISIEKFWKLADDLLYTKVFYDERTDNYFTKKFRKEDDLDFAVAKALKDFRSSSSSSPFCGVLSDDDDELEDCSEDEINTLLVSYLTLVSKYADELTHHEDGDDQKFYTSVAKYLLNYKYYQEHVDFCIRKMLSLLTFTVKTNLHNLNLDVDQLSIKVKNEVNDNINLNECFIKTIGFIFYEHYKDYKHELFNSLNNCNGFHIMWMVIKNYCELTDIINSGDDPFGGNYKNYFVMLFDMLSERQFTIEELNVVDGGTLVKLFKMLKLLGKSDDPLNYIKFKLILVLNEQFIGCYGMGDFSVKNRVFATILGNLHKMVFQRFFELVLFNFNRVDSPIDQILIMKFLYLVFLNEKTHRLVYFNDVKVVIDIIIRQLCDLGPGKHEHLVNIFIRVVHLMLLSTQLRISTYKQKELKQVLGYLSTNEMATARTRELAKKCLLGDFFLLNSNQSDPHLPLLEKPELPLGAISCPDLTVGEQTTTTTPPPVPPPRGEQFPPRVPLKRASTDNSLASQRACKPPPPLPTGRK